MVGRDADLELLGQLVIDLRRGQGSNVLVAGEAGIGKTSLVRWIGEAVRAGGGKVFAGAAHPFERARPFGPLTDALDMRRRSTDPRRAAIASLLSGDDGSRSRVTGPVVDVRYRVIDDIVDLLETERHRTAAGR